MHGQHGGKRQQQWHMWPAPSQRPVLGTVTDSAGNNCFSKAGRKIGVGDCALFQAGNAPPFIGIIRKVTPEKEGNLKLSVNWLYRPGDIKLARAVPVEATPNEVFYSFHKDEISAASLLHPCKVAFLQKGVELPSGVSSFICRRVYDITNKCLYWLTDQDYTDECQQEVDRLLDRTKRKMQTAAQLGVSSQRAVSGPTLSPQSKPDGANTVFPYQGKGKKRERTDQSLEPCKRERSVKLEDSDLGATKRECSMKLEEIASITDKDGGLLNIPAVDQLVQVMQQEQNESAKKSGDVASRQTLLTGIVAATERDDCLTRFVQLGGLPVLNDWLQEAHKGKVADGATPKDGEKGMEELLLTLLRALDKLPIDLDALKTCPIGKSVKNLRNHRNSEIQKKARKLVDIWKRRVDPEWKSSRESRSGLNSTTVWSCKQPSSEMHGGKGRGSTEGASEKSLLGPKPVVNVLCPGDSKSNTISGSVGKEAPAPFGIALKDTPKFLASGTNEIALAAVKEEKSSSSSQSQNNSQSWCSGSLKGTGSWKEEVKNSFAISTGTKATTMTTHSNILSGKGHPVASTTGPSKESAPHKSLGGEKVSSSNSEKGAAESGRVEISNNQRLIVRLPNPGRSPARSSNGSSFADGGITASRASLHALSEKQELIDDMNKLSASAPLVHLSAANGDPKSGNGNIIGLKSGADGVHEKSRSCPIAANDEEWKALEADHVQKENEGSLSHSDLSGGKCQPGGLQSGCPKKCISASVAGLGCSEISPELQDEGGIDLLASVAASEGFETENGFSGITGEERCSPVNCGIRQPAKQTPHPNEMDLHHKNENFPVSHEDDDNRTKLNVKALSEAGATGDIMDTGSVSVQEVKVPVDVCKEPFAALTSSQSAEDRASDGVLESTLVSSDSSMKDISASEALPDGYNMKKDLRREDTDEGKANILKRSSDICIGISCPADCQTGATSGLDNVGLLEEGFEDAKKSSSSSPSSLMRMSPPEDGAKAVDSGSGYYEDDALEVARKVAKEVQQEVEVARKVAKEVEQEVEQYTLPEMQDTNTSVSKTELKLDNSACGVANDQQIPSGEADAGLNVCYPDRCCTGSEALCDDNREPVIERRKGMEAGTTPAKVGGVELEKASYSLDIPEKLRPALESEFGCNEVTKEVRDGAVSEACSQSTVAIGQKDLVDTVVCNGQTAEASAFDQSKEFRPVSNDGKGGSNGTSGRPMFDLNEGFVAEDIVHDDVPTVRGCSVNPTGLVSSTVIPNLLPAPIAVVAATKGAFIPPSTLLRSKGELGWKGSAATSAFRPAEPRRIAEAAQSPPDNVGTRAMADVIGHGEKRAQMLDIDLNVADERVMEDMGVALSLPSQNHATSLGLGPHVPTGSANESSSAGFVANSSPVTSRLELDLNRIDESEESTGPLMSDSRDAEVSLKNSKKFSLASSRILRDFDLNDGPDLEESLMEGVLSQQSNVRTLENSALPCLPGMRSNAEVVNVASWYPAANPMHAMVMPTFSASRAESPYPVVAAPTAKSVITMGHSPSPFNGDLYRTGTVMPSSSSVSYSTTMPAPFPYTGFSFGSGFPFTSASYKISSTPYGSSSNSPPFPNAPSQLVSAGAVVSSYGRPYLMGIAEVPEADNGSSWARPNLDLNAGPEAINTDGREEARHIPSLSQISFQSGGSSGVPLKRKEPEGGFDPFRSGVKQMVWR